MKGKVTLRAATKADRREIRNLVWGARLNPMGLDWRRFVVAVNPAGEVIACVQIKPHRDGSQELASLVVSPDYRGRGIARYILERLMQDHGGELYLMCRASLGEFYRKFGFEVVTENTMPPYFSRISKLASLLGLFRDQEESLVIMKR
jgi:amino-acid N-acetyltransferase